MWCTAAVVHTMRHMARITRQTISDQLRRRVREVRDCSLARLAASAGLSRSTLSRFVRGRCRLSMDAFDRLCLVLDLRLVVTATAQKRRAEEMRIVREARGEVAPGAGGTEVEKDRDGVYRPRRRLG
jgi:transcriptional regulator with XRE-family HTH domain